MSEGFVLWEIAGNENEIPLFLKGNGTDMIVHVLMLSGEMKMGWGGRLYPLTKDCFANFIDCPSLEIRDISEDTQAYVMLSAEKYSAVSAFVCAEDKGMARIRHVFRNCAAFSEED